MAREGWSLARVLNDTLGLEMDLCERIIEIVDDSPDYWRTEDVDKLVREISIYG